MFDPSTIPAEAHPSAKFWLDVTDKFIKLIAVLVGAAWTWMNYSRSRTYAKKLELQLSGSTFRKRDLYIEITAGIKNLGASRHSVQQEGTTCEILAIGPDLSETPVRLIPVFELDDWIEPGESINDLIQYKVNLPPEEVIWLRVNLRVISKELEWNSSYLLKVD